MNFIGEYYLEDDVVCDELINLFNSSNKKQIINQTFIDSNGDSKIVKKSTDLPIPPELFDTNYTVNNYLNQLTKCLDKYVDEYFYCNYYANWGPIEPFIIQYYQPNEGFLHFHTERATTKEPYCYRHLVFMTYLNDVGFGGETEFFYQKYKCRPKKGKTLIWPVDWTHTHRGVVSPTHEKYITTGWFSFCDFDQIKGKRKTKHK